MLKSNKNPPAFAVATDSDVANVIATVGFPWVPSVAVVSAVAGIPAAIVVLAAVYIPGVYPL